MFVYGICAGPSGKVDRIALPALRRADPTGAVLVRSGQSSIFEAYNSILAEAARLEGVEGVVLLHDDLELLDDSVAATLREVFSDPGVGLAGLVGGRGARTLQWWTSEPAGHVHELTRELAYSTGLTRVDVVDGIFLALSPAALRTVRFDTRRYQGFHGYDADVSRTVAAAGLQVVVVDLEARHHTMPGQVSNLASYRLAGLQWQAKWLRDDPLATRVPRRFYLTRARAQNRLAALAERNGRAGVAEALRRRVPEPHDGSPEGRRSTSPGARRAADQLKGG